MSNQHTRRRREEPLFVVFEGIDGAGKTTQVARFAERLGRSQLVWKTREPTNGEWGKKAKAPGKVPGRLLYFLHDRKEHVQEVILPYQALGYTIVCDRYEPSTLVYQTILHGHPRPVVEAAMSLVDAPKPDLVIWLRVPPERAVERETPLEAEQTSREQQLRDFRMLDQMYEVLAAENPKTWVEVNGLGSRVYVHNQIWNAFIAWRKEHGR